MTPKRRRYVVERLTASGCHSIRNKGGHQVWQCPCGKHLAPLPNHRTTTAGVVRSIQNQMACLPKGWLQ